MCFVDLMEKCGEKDKSEPPPGSHAYLILKEWEIYVCVLELILHLKHALFSSAIN